jgi:hypothetical protein
MMPKTAKKKYTAKEIAKKKARWWQGWEVAVVAVDHSQADYADADFMKGFHVGVAHRQQAIEQNDEYYEVAAGLDKSLYDWTFSVFEIPEEWLFK